MISSLGIIWRLNGNILSDWIPYKPISKTAGIEKCVINIEGPCVWLYFWIRVVWTQNCSQRNWNPGTHRPRISTYSNNLFWQNYHWEEIIFGSCIIKIIHNAFVSIGSNGLVIQWRCTIECDITCKITIRIHHPCDIS